MKALSSVKALPVLLLLSVVLVLSCDSGLESDGSDDGRDDIAGPFESFYRIEIRHGEFAILEGIETEWALDQGIVVLGPEEYTFSGPEDNGPPTWRLELGLRAGNDGIALIDYAAFSRTDVRRGTGAELNARLYTLSPTSAPECEVELISASRISADCGQRGLAMDRVLVNPDDVPDRDTVGVVFLATDAE